MCRSISSTLAITRRKSGIQRRLFVKSHPGRSSASTCERETDCIALVAWRGWDPSEARLAKTIFFYVASRAREDHKESVAELPNCVTHPSQIAVATPDAQAKDLQPLQHVCSCWPTSDKQRSSTSSRSTQLLHGYPVLITNLSRTRTLVPPAPFPRTHAREGGALAGLAAWWSSFFANAFTNGRPSFSSHLVK
jgi:hypothetical protein